MHVFPKIIYWIFLGIIFLIKCFDRLLAGKTRMLITQSPHQKFNGFKYYQFSLNKKKKKAKRKLDGRDCFWMMTWQDQVVLVKRHRNNHERMGGSNLVYCHYLIDFALYFLPFPFPSYVQAEIKSSPLDLLRLRSLLSHFFCPSLWRLRDLHRSGTSSLLLFSCSWFMELTLSTFLVLPPRTSRRLVVANTLVCDLFVFIVCIVVVFLDWRV